ncbi:N-acetylglucosamine-6-phosphate deacetylase [Alkaliphilus metalliredigens QYMF]|uniref:N-acetylglucosamine-6-phosphate deacetylase n=1 Tax=Alkaliphilus metalliredigens (strain QYMF) TaxID=293826 RepID=A6TVP4_ALKMQ|nr:N-acetylglucosamine-6-phosphate deacetylase [Alkaliphilus metalliredigens]ABR50262.1 N-acetylglucosamine-6-phosphate deacetylase [Alkaliphilus metalliredigens QYMF]
MIALYNGKIILADEILEDKVLLFDDKIRGIIHKSQFQPNGVKKVIDVGGQYISPGFIDIHIHGSGGSDTMDGTLEDLNIISDTILRQGTTGFLPTTMTMDMKSIHKALDVIREATSQDMKGAQVLGAHMEGPFINVQYKGAQNQTYVVEPEKSYIEDYLDVIKIITLAPEVKGGQTFLEAMKSNPEITLAIGHSQATYDEAMGAIENGVRHATHLFNAMTPLHHREPGIVGAVFNSQITCELIADKIHVHPDLFKLIYRIKGRENVILITDAIRAGCMKEGTYDLGGQGVTVAEGSARLENGSLAGSVLTLNKAVKHFTQATKLPLHDVIHMVTLNPARLIGIQDQKGSITTGKDADLIVFNENIEVSYAFVKGYQKL